MRALPRDMIIDCSISYTGSSVSDVSKIVEHFGTKYNFYDYREWLNSQTGWKIEEISEPIYTTFPSIVFVTKDWFERPATILEMKYLAKNPNKKLVVDYLDDFACRESEHEIDNYSFVDFDCDGNLSLNSVHNFLLEIYPNA